MLGAACVRTFLTKNLSQEPAVRPSNSAKQLPACDDVSSCFTILGFAQVGRSLRQEVFVRHWEVCCLDGASAPFHVEVVVQVRSLPVACCFQDPVMLCAAKLAGSKSFVSRC